MISELFLYHRIFEEDYTTLKPMFCFLVILAEKVGFRFAYSDISPLISDRFSPMRNQA